MMQGDSRRLGEVLARASLCLSSPPYAGSIHKGGHGIDAAKLTGNKAGLNSQALIMDGYGREPGQLAAMPDTGFEAALAVSSPAWHKVVLHDGGPVQQQGGELHSDYGSEPGQLAQMPEGDLALALGSPPYAGSLGDGKSGIDWSKQADRETAHSHGWDGDGYGQAPGQLAALPEGDHAEACERPVCAISSPPYIGTPVSAQGADGKSQEWNNAYREYQRTGDHAKFQAQMTKKCDRAGYGSEQGQLGQMPTGSHAEALRPEALEAGAVTERAQCCVSSPPYAQSPIAAFDSGVKCSGGLGKQFRLGNQPGGQEQVGKVGYGNTAGQLGQETGSTFWAASREILEEVYKVLAPGGHAIWVLKMFVKSGRLVDFPRQWETLCQSVGFKTVCKHRAWMNKDAGTVQITLDGEEVSMEKWYKSFFRILCEKKGAPRIDWELILCMVKPS